MSLYRQVGGPSAGRLAAGAAVLLAVGLLIGFGAGRASAPEPGLDETVAELSDQVRPAVDALELVGLHYDDPGSGSDVQREGARAQAQSAVDVLEANADDLRALDPDGYESALASAKDLVAMIDAGAPPAKVTSAATATATEIESLARL